MGLNWNMEQVADWEAKCTHPSDPDRLSPVADAIIWMTLAIDLGEITEKNLAEFWKRTAAYQTLGAPMQTTDGPVYLTREDIEDFIGLRTNVTNRPSAHFAKRLLTMATDEGLSIARKQGKSARKTLAELAKKIAD